MKKTSFAWGIPIFSHVILFECPCCRLLLLLRCERIGYLCITFLCDVMRVFGKRGSPSIFLSCVPVERPWSSYSVSLLLLFYTLRAHRSDCVKCYWVIAYHVVCDVTMVFGKRRDNHPSLREHYRASNDSCWDSGIQKLRRASD